MNHKHIMKNGFTLFFAMLVGSLALAVGLAIFDLTLRELTLSNAVAQSQYAIYAADTGAECALYWDNKCTLAGCTANGASNSVFSTSTDDTGRITYGATGSGVYCNAQDITDSDSPGGVWSISTLGPTTTTSFLIYVSDQSQVSNRSTCARVSVSKAGNPSRTYIISRGYNTCTTGAQRTERALQVSY